MTDFVPLRVGVVGTGGMARAHLAAWQQLGADALVFSRSGSSLRASALAGEYGARAENGLSSLLAQCDVVDICTPTETHHDLAAAAFEAGRHVICEKPVALTSGQAVDMAARARSARRQLHVAHVVRYFAAYAAAQAAVRDGAIGTPTDLRLTRIGAAPTAEWFHDEERSGGVLMDQLIHDFDYARWIAGEVVAVEARTTPHTTERGANYVTAEATLRHANGAVSHLAGGWLEPETPFRTAFSISGPGGELTHSSSGDTPGAVLLARTGAAPQELIAAEAVAADRPFVTQLGDFAAAITDGAPPRLTAADALAALELSLAARRSAQSGRPETVRSL